MKPLLYVGSVVVVGCAGIYWIGLWSPALAGAVVGVLCVRAFRH